MRQKTYSFFTGSKKVGLLKCSNLRYWQFESGMRLIFMGFFFLIMFTITLNQLVWQNCEIDFEKLNYRPEWQHLTSMGQCLSVCGLCAKSKTKNSWPREEVNGQIIKAYDPGYPRNIHIISCFQETSFRFLGQRQDYLDLGNLDYHKCRWTYSLIKK